MALGGSGGYYSASTIPSAEAALHSVYSRHIWARASALPSTATLRFVASLRNGFSSGFTHDEFAWDHTAAAFYRSHYHRSGGYVSAQMAAASFAVDTWISFAATFDGTNVRSYVNGVLDGVSAGTSASSAGGTQVVQNASGNYDSFPSYAFTHGQSAEYGVWDVLLTIEEIQSLAKGLRPSRVRPGQLVFYAPGVRGKQDLVGGRTLLLGVGSETITDHPRVYG